MADRHSAGVRQRWSLLNSRAAAARALRRRDDTPAITADQISFAAIRQHAIRSMTWSSVTSSAPAAALRAAAEDAALSALRTLVTTGRNRHSPREQKHRPRFPHTAATKTTPASRKSPSSHHGRH
jgi:hypothetical protein